MGERGRPIPPQTSLQVITGSHDSTIRLWDIRKAKTATTLTYHKKSVRAMAMHPKEYAFASASADNIKKFKLPNVPPPPTLERPLDLLPSTRPTNSPAWFCFPVGFPWMLRCQRR